MLPAVKTWNSCISATKSCMKTISPLNCYQILLVLIVYVFFWCKHFHTSMSQQQKVICTAQKMKFSINPFSTNVPCLYPPENRNLRFSDVFKGYRSRALVENGLRISSVNVTKSAENWRIWWYLLWKSLMENLIFCGVTRTVNPSNQILC